MQILVTGGAGFIGTNLIKELIKQGHRVVSIDNYSIGSKDNHVEGAKYIDGDLEILHHLKNQYDTIYHLAALSRIQPSFTHPSSTFIANTAGTQQVCDFALRNDSKLIYAGSSSKWHNPYRSPYALYKHLGEEICKMYKKSFGLRAEIARFYNVYGPYEVVDGDWAAVIGVWRRQIREGQRVTIVGDGKQRRDFTHVEDIVDGLIKISESNISHNDAWELGTGINYSINEVFKMFLNRFQHIESKFIPDQSGNYRKTLRENNDSLEKLNWKPTDKLKEYIESL